MTWKYALAPIIGPLVLVAVLAWVLLILIPCEIMWLGMWALGEEERGNAFMEFATGMIP